jgi:hypothetical protein
MINTSEVAAEMVLVFQTSCTAFRIQVATSNKLLQISCDIVHFRALEVVEEGA